MFGDKRFGEMNDTVDSENWQLHLKTLSEGERLCQ